MENEHRFRFTPPTETSAKARLEAFRFGVKKFQEKHPEVLGATLFGSMTQGENAHSESDIDAVMFIDGERIPKENVVKADSNSLFYQIYLHYPNLATEEKYRSMFFKEMDISQGDIEKYYNSFSTKVINEKIIDEEISEFLKSGNEYKEWRELFETKEYATLSIEEKDRLMMKNDVGFVDPSIFFMFCASVGKGIEKYRQLFLKKLYNLSDKKTAEHMWEGVYWKVLFLNKVETIL